MRFASLLTLIVLSLAWTPALAADGSPPTPLPSPSPSVTATPPAPALRGVTSALLGAINKDRARHRVGALLLDSRQSNCSRKHSVHMAHLGYLSHDQFPLDICVPFDWAGENVGVYRGDPKQAALLLHRMMMYEGPCPHTSCPGSEFEKHGHYLNLINPRYKHVGIGLVVKAGSLWLTENFTD